MMPSRDEELSPIARLTYKPGETIIKGGDYGISIYLVIEGKVEIYIESGDYETSIAIIGPGEMIGEMIFLAGNQARRSASARATEYTVLESLHPSRISREYSNVPLMIKHMVSQTVKRLKHMNQMVVELDAAKAKEEELKNYDPWRQHRKFYRKKVDIEIMYRPIDHQDKIIMWGKIIDLSRSGMRLDVPKINQFKCSHAPGDMFAASAFLPNGRRVDLKVKIVRIYGSNENNILSLGLVFFDLDEDINKKLGFFLKQ